MIGTDWDSRAGALCDARAAALDGAEGARLLEKLAAVFPAENGPLRILDAGTGTGYLALLLTRLGHTIIGVDSAPAMIQRAYETAAARGERIEFRIGDCRRLDFEDESFDAVVSCETAGLLGDLSAAYGEWYRVLRRGGLLLVLDREWAGKDGAQAGTATREDGAAGSPMTGDGTSNGAAGSHGAERETAANRLSGSPAAEKAAAADNAFSHEAGGEAPAGDRISNGGAAGSYAELGGEIADSAAGSPMAGDGTSNGAAANGLLGPSASNGGTVSYAIIGGETADGAAASSDSHASGSPASNGAAARPARDVETLRLIGFAHCRAEEQFSDGLFCVTAHKPASATRMHIPQLAQYNRYLRATKNQLQLYGSWCASHGTAYTDYTVLHLVNHHAKGARPSDISSALVIPRQTLTRVLAELEKAGCISRSVNEADRRSAFIRITPAGRERLEQLHDLLHAAESRALEHFSVDELSRFADFSERLLDAYTEAFRSGG